jgi:nucleoid DNA-binding protein
MPTKTTTSKTGTKTGAAKATTTRRLTKPKLVHSEAAPAAAAAPAGDGMAEGKAPASGLRLKDLVERVVAATGGKKKGVKEIVEATLTQMGDALQRGETLHLPAFGKARVAKAGAEGGGAMTVKLRRGPNEGRKAKAAAEDKDALAEESEQG